NRGQDVVAGEQQLRGSVGEDVMTGSVPGRVDSIQRPRPDRDLVVALEPRVGVAPDRLVGYCALDLVPLHGKLGSARSNEACEERRLCSRSFVVVEQVEGGLLIGSERDVGPVLLAE